MDPRRRKGPAIVPMRPSEINRKENANSGSKSFRKKGKMSARDLSPPRRNLSDLKSVSSEGNKGKSGRRGFLRKSKSSEKTNEAVQKDLSVRSSGRRTSFKLTASKKEGSSKCIIAPTEEEVQTEDDPVMDMFQTRNTNRVRFSLDPTDDDDTKGQPSPDRSGLPGSGNSSFNIKAFMRRTLFGGSRKGMSFQALEDEARQDMESDKIPGLPQKATTKPTMIWESAETGDSPEVIHTMTSPKTSGSENLMVSFAEDKKTRNEVSRLLSKAKRAQHNHYNYTYAIKCYVRALDKLTEAEYPEDHPTMCKTREALNNAHHAETSFKNSANIVKMGLRHEESGELVKALKMYTIAYRIRRDNLSQSHPSLVVLLNMLGSIQMKRGEFKEAMQIYELALKDTPVGSDDDEDSSSQLHGNPLARSVSFRDMGTIYERWGEEAKALEMYQKSLECASEWRAKKKPNPTKPAQPASPKEETRTLPEQQGSDNVGTTDRVKMARSSQAFAEKVENGPRGHSEVGEMEVFLTTPDESGGLSGDTSMTRLYNSFFPLENGKSKSGRKKSNSSSSVRTAAAEERDSFADVDVALTLHQIGQLYRKQGQYSMALDAYGAALRGMKHALGPHHPNIAAILGNIGNLHKEKGDMDSAYETYQQVLKIESRRLGLSHPEVAITLHNIGTIEAARGNYEQALTIYRKVLALQKRLLGDEHVSIAVTTSCMGDVYQKLGDLEKAMELGEDALRIKMKTLGKHTIEVARMLHKLEKIAFEQQSYNLANSYVTRAILIYRLNKVEETHEWIVDAHRDAADIDAAMAMGAGRYCEC